MSIHLAAVDGNLVDTQPEHDGVAEYAHNLAVAATVVLGLANEEPNHDRRTALRIAANCVLEELRHLTGEMG